METYNSNVNQNGIDQHYLSGMYKAISVVSFLMATGIISLNGLVIYILARQKGNNRLHFFIFHLAIADLCVGLVSVLGDGVFEGIPQQKWLLGDVMCRVWRYSVFVVVIASSNLLIGMSVDRYLAVRYSLRAITGEYRPYKAIIIGSWIMALLIPVWKLLYTGVIQDFDQTTYYFAVEFTTAIASMLYKGIILLVFFIPFLANCVCYICLSVVVWKHWRESRNLTEMNSILEDSTVKPCRETRNSVLLPKARIKTIKMTLIMCFALFTCWLPITVCTVVAMLGGSVDFRYVFVLHCLRPLNSMCNPIIFLLFSKHLLPCGSPKSSETVMKVLTPHTPLHE